MKEKDIENQILTWLNLQRFVFAFKVKTTGYYDPTKKIFRKNNSPFVIRGTSDIIGSYRGRILAIEVKTQAGYRKFTKNPGEHELNQYAFLEDIIDTGGIAMCVCSLEDVIRNLAMIENTAKGKQQA